MDAPIKYGSDILVTHNQHCTTIMQRTVPHDYAQYPNIIFGPLSTTIDDMFQRGYWLQLTATGKDKSLYTTRRCKVYLQDTQNRYRVGSISWGILQSSVNELGQYDLCQVLDNRNLISAHSPTRTPSGYFRPADIWKPIMDKYPRRKTKTMMGNRTLLEYIKDELA